MVGSCNVDYVVRAVRLPRPGETVLGGDVERFAGGKGANQAAAGARLGATTSLVASVGNDDEGEWLLDGLGARGVDLTHVQRSRRATGTAFITIDAVGENQIVVAPGANTELDLVGVDLTLYDVVLAQLEIAPSVVAQAATRATRFVLNAAPVVDVDADTLARCAVVIVNEHEAESLDLATLEHCVVTLGSRGAARYTRGRLVARAEAARVETLDTVGAGDVFCAAYAVALARGESDEDCLRFASVAGSLATRQPGAQGALPTEEEVTAWLARA